MLDALLGLSRVVSGGGSAVASSALSVYAKPTVAAANTFGIPPRFQGAFGRRYVGPSGIYAAKPSNASSIGLARLDEPMLALRRLVSEYAYSRVPDTRSCSQRRGCGRTYVTLDSMAVDSR